jgi:regulatory protein
MKSRASDESNAALDERRARAKCLELLSQRARSTAELRERLEQGGFAESVIREVLEGLADAGLLDDEEFARSWVASRKAAGGFGRRKLLWELSRKGVSRSVIERVLDEELDDETELHQATQLARKRLRAGEPGGSEMPRLRRYLLSRGYEFETVDSVLQTITREKGA